MDVERSCSGRFAQDQARRIELELTQPKPATRNGRRCSVVLLGIGDTGKSQFIRHLTNTVVDTPTVKTTEIREWEVDIPFNENRPGDNQAAHQQHVTCYVTDYVGQNLGSLVEYFMIEQKTRLSKMAYGHINVLCLLVDLAKGDPLKAKKNAVPNPLRIQEQIDEWNGQTLAAIWGLVTGKKFKHVVLFVNKCDAIPNRPTDFEKIAVPLYQELIDRVQSRFPDQQLHIVAGSAETGENVGEVVSVIIKVIILLAKEVPGVLAFIGGLIKRTFILIHSEIRLLCMTDAMLGALAGYFCGNALIGGVVGAILGVVNYKLVSVRWLKLVRA